MESPSSPDLHARAKALPVTPGAYLFRDARGTVLYVGKANVLRKRVLQYFDPARLEPGKQEMIRQARSIETIVTATEAEALVLEATLIQQHTPPYNVRLLDDSSYLYVKITNALYPEVSLTRRVLPDGAWYRGPFPSARAIRATIKEARKLFGWCAYPHPDQARGRACFAYHLGLCPGICVGAISLEEYQKVIERLKRFLDGETASALRTLEERMRALSSGEQYERAARVRDAMRAITEATRQQNVVTPGGESLDALGFGRHGTHAAVAVLQVRHGRVIGTQIFSLLHPSDEPTPAVIRGFLLQYYRNVQGMAPTIVLPSSIEDASSIAAWLSALSERTVRLEIAQRGWKRKMIDLAAANAQEALRTSLTELTSPTNLQQALHDLATTLHLSAPPQRIETYDISNIQGTLATASMVVFTDGKPTPSQYRKFRIVTENTPNDFAMMREVLLRRFTRNTAGTKKEWPLPHLILLDGGKGQLNIGRTVLKDRGLDIPLAALAKREEELFLPEQATPVVLPRTSPALYLLQRMRDEAHRFTLGYHRLLRKKRMTRSLLEDIPGVGPATRKKLLRAFGSLQGIRAASYQELAAIVGSPQRAGRIQAFLNTALMEEKEGQKRDGQ